jgi:hypothetical protein
MLPEPTRQRRALVRVRAVWDVFSLKPEDYPFQSLTGAPFEGASAKSWFLAIVPLLHHGERTVAVAARWMHSSNRRLQRGDQIFSEDMVDLDALTSLVDPPRDLDHAVCDMDGLRAPPRECWPAHPCQPPGGPCDPATRKRRALRADRTNCRRGRALVVPALGAPRARRTRRTRRPYGRTRVCVCTRGWTSSGK